MELYGKTVGGLQVIEFDCYKKIGQRDRPYWKVKCECGFEFSKNQAEIMSASKNNIHTVCRKCSALKAGYAPKKHGLRYHPLYYKWQDMKSRLIRDPNYSNRTICKEWNESFMSFYNWAINNGYEDGLQIDRKENDGNYEPSNCRFVSKQINMQNTRAIRKNNTSGHRGVSYCKTNKKWKAKIMHNNKQISLGYYVNIDDAIKAYENYVDTMSTEHNY